jgi:hypothetical protein
MRDLVSRFSNRIQLTTDGLSVHVNTVNITFGSDIDCAPQTSRTTDLGVRNY